MARTRQNAKKTTSGTAPRSANHSRCSCHPHPTCIRAVHLKGLNTDPLWLRSGVTRISAVAHGQGPRRRHRLPVSRLPRTRRGWCEVQRATFVLLLGTRIPMLDKPVIISGICERASKSQVCAESTLILELVCTGVEIQGKGESGEDVAMEVGEFMRCLFTSPLQNMVYGSTLFMLTCGPVVSFEQSLAALKQSIAQPRIAKGAMVLMVPQPSAPMGHISIHGVPELWCHPSMGTIKAGPSSTKWLSPEDSSIHCVASAPLKCVLSLYWLNTDVLHGDPTSGWLKYTVCAAVPL
ncbi:hypothetical protein BKA82DRAFT_4016099 [Pisolithus tinctorius]|nr:hypothetical protein BKA82DRAFT_4016099 [Pisolithus tinctorius]